MSSISRVLHIILHILLSIINNNNKQVEAQPNPYSFNIQHIGHTRYVTPEDEKKRDFCTNYWCTNDAHYLFTKSSQYVGIDPCVDFKNFSVNRADIIDVTDDRDVFRGFTRIAEKKYHERLRKVVAAEFDPVKDNRVIKVMKNTFSHCVKSAHVLRHVEAHKDLVEYLSGINGSPYLGKHSAFNTEKFNEASDFGVWNLFSNKVLNDFTNESAFWSGENFNLSRYFEVEPFHALDYFFDLKVSRCGGVVCLKRSENWDFYADKQLDFEDFFEVFRTLDDAIFTRPQLRKILIHEVYWPAVRNKREFEKKRDKVQKSCECFEITRLTINELQEKFPAEFRVNWLRIVNEVLFDVSKVTADEEILIEGGVEMLQALVRILLETDKRIIADAFDVSFIYGQRYNVILRFNNAHTVATFGVSHGWQRWETCLFQLSLETHMRPALLAMYERERTLWDRTRGDFDRDLMDERSDIVGSAEKFVGEAAEEFKRLFLADAAPHLPLDVAIDVLSKLKQMKIVISLQSKIFPIGKLEEFYAELPLGGDENYLPSLWEMQKFYRKLRNEPKSSWRRQIDETLDTANEFTEYNIDDGNIFYLSPVVLVYPLYHPLRPRFFNMVLLFNEVFISLFKGMKKYLRKHRGIEIQSEKSFFQLGFEYYKKWLRSNKELQIGANYLTNEQLYWVALGVSFYKKFHRTAPSSLYSEDRLQTKYFHVSFKSFAGFQEAFHCNLTQREKKKLQNYTNEFRNING